MLDTAIIGGGLCGLALAHSLQAQRVDWALFEASHRLGGRVLTARSSEGAALDLGPTWYWPDTQPSITRLVADLGLASLAQADDGRVLLLDDPNRSPRACALTGAGQLDPQATPRPGAVHGGARRLVAGMQGLTDALVGRLAPQRLHTGHALVTLCDRGDHVALQFAEGAQHHRLAARRVVLALPPRAAQHAITFDPPLPASLDTALRATRTWMATAAKAAVGFSRPFWRDAGHSGNAWVTHPQAVLAEVFDAGPPAGAPGAALAGFVALGVEGRGRFRAGLPMLIDSQLGMLFGLAAQDGELQLHDWAEVPTVCSPLDRSDDGDASHPRYGDEALAQPQWQGRLWFGGSETARQGGGYLEGALGAAARLRRQLIGAPVAGRAPAANETRAQPGAGGA